MVESQGQLMQALGVGLVVGRLGFLLDCDGLDKGEKDAREGRSGLWGGSILCVGGVASFFVFVCFLVFHEFFSFFPSLHARVQLDHRPRRDRKQIVYVDRGLTTSLMKPFSTFFLTFRARGSIP